MIKRVLFQKIYLGDNAHLYKSLVSDFIAKAFFAKGKHLELYLILVKFDKITIAKTCSIIFLSYSIITFYTLK